MQKYSAILGLVFGVGLLVLAQFVGAMGEFALLAIGTAPELHKLFAEL